MSPEEMEDFVCSLEPGDGRARTAATHAEVVAQVAERSRLRAFLGSLVGMEPGVSLKKV
jgi:hypothetical protein